MDGRRALGASGERLAEHALRRAGLRVIARNARTRFGELDLVCHGPRGYVFVEVKTRDERSFVRAAEAAPVAKVRRLARLGAAWLAHAGLAGTDWSLLLVAVTVGPDGGHVELIPLGP